VEFQTYEDDYKWLGYSTSHDSMGITKFKFNALTGEQRLSLKKNKINC